MKKSLFIFLLILSAVGLVLSGCKSDPSEVTDLSGTRWAGSYQGATIEVSFTNTQCTTTLSGPVNGKAIGTYTTDGSVADIKFTSVSGDAAYYIRAGETATAEYDLWTREMRLVKSMGGQGTLEILLDRID